MPAHEPSRGGVRAIPYNSKCRYGEQGAADAVPQLPERCLSRKAGIVRLPKAVHLAGNVALRLYQMLLNSSGPAKDRAVEIGYGILPSYEGNGYMTEAVQGMIRWAFAQQDVNFVEAETDPDNRASQRILEKCGFVPNGKTGEEGSRFVVERPQTT